MSLISRIGVVGVGAIGATICRAVDDGAVDAELAGICELDEAKATDLQAQLRRPVANLDLADLAAASDLLVEAVSPELAPRVVRAALAAGCSAMVMSVAGLIEAGELVDEARAASQRIYVPSGAIAGLDAVRAAAVAGLDEVTLTTTKPPAGLAGAPYLSEHGIGLTGLTAPRVVFEGPASAAVKAFPKNVNVSAALSLAGIGPERTLVRVVADPTTDRNTHEITAVGSAGRLLLRVDNVPAPDNPKTSYLAALSAVALLQRLTSSLVIGS